MPLTILRLIAIVSGHPCAATSSNLSCSPFPHSAQGSELCLAEMLEIEYFASRVPVWSLCPFFFHVTSSKARSFCQWLASGCAWDPVLTIESWGKVPGYNLTFLPVGNGLAITSLKLRLQTNSNSDLGLKGPANSHGPSSSYCHQVREATVLTMILMGQPRNLCAVFQTRQKVTSQTLDISMNPVSSDIYLPWLFYMPLIK